jgi:2-polyprenyl-3-methyl-5-hydroxy-6-metoxy-1,4-benzoquinol methylase
VKIKYEKEKNALKHYDNINYFDKNKFLNAAITKSEFDKVIKKYKVKLANSSVLDFGCGTGETTLYTIGKYNAPAVHCVDYNQTRLNVLKKALLEYPNKKHRVTVEQADVNIFLEQNIKKYDVIFAFEIIEHLQNPDNVMKQLKDILSPNGILIGTVPIQQAANSVHLTAFKTVDEIENRLKVSLDSSIQLRYGFQRLFIFIKTGE